MVSQWYYNTTLGLDIRNSSERLIVIGGYGGWPTSDERFEGFRYLLS
jgi:hypothetical protein